MITQKFVLCQPPDSCCPAIEIREDGTVRIGEDDQIAVLNTFQWNLLVSKIQDGTLKKI